MKFKLNEDLFDDVIIVPEVATEIEVDAELKGPETPEELGISTLILDAIANCTKNIDQYNTMKANINNPEMVSVLDDICNEENRTLGKLQGLLKEVSPNAENIMHGAIEVENTPVLESLNEDTNNSVYADYESIEKYLNSNNFTNYDLIDYSSYPLNTSKITIRIKGDWKHDHWRFKELVQEWADKNNRNIFKVDSEEVGESDSDYYTADYDIYITKDKESFDTLNSMRGLFTESTNKDRSLKETKLNEGDWEDPEWRKYYGVDDDSFYDPFELEDGEVVDDDFDESFTSEKQLERPINKKSNFTPLKVQLVQQPMVVSEEYGVVNSDTNTDITNTNDALNMYEDVDLNMVDDEF